MTKTSPEVLAEMRRLIRVHGTQAAAARAILVSATYFSDVLNSRRAPGEGFLKALGMKLVKVYKRKERGNGRGK